MSSATHTSKGPIADSRPVGTVSLLAPSRTIGFAERLELTRAFAAVVGVYMFRVLPQAQSELAQLRIRATEIPNPKLRRAAEEALAKRGNIEGAALFASLAPAAERRVTVRALVAFQAAYNYLDALSELSSEDPVANGDQLHQALLTALHPDAPHDDYYARNPDHNDGGFLTAIVDSCRDAVTRLPSYAAVAPTARAAAARIVDFQALNVANAHGGHAGLRKWATDATPARSGLAWWETAAGAGSSLAVHALIAAAANPALDPRVVREIDRAYFPWIGALHSLLDSLVDRREDRENGQCSLLDYYHSPTDAAIHLAGLAVRARGAAERLPSPREHRVIVTAMCSYYLSAPQCCTPGAHMVTRCLTRVLGVPLNIAIAMFRSKRLLHTLTRRPYV